MDQNNDEQDDLHACYLVTFGGPEGRRVLADIMKAAHHGQSAFTDNDRRTSFMLGQQSVALHIHKQLNEEKTHG